MNKSNNELKFQAKIIVLTEPHGERSIKLIWKRLENIFPFTRQTMYSKIIIREAYDKAQIVLKTGQRPKVKDPLSTSDELQTQKLKYSKNLF